MLQKLKDWMLPLAILTGVIFYPFFVQFVFLTPYLLFSMLLIPFCKLTFRNIRFTKLHLWLLFAQLAGSLATYLLLCPIDPLIAQGAMICVLAPTATAAPVITGMLGGNIASLASYSLLSNMGVALLAPVVFSFIGTHSNMPFIESVVYICKTVIPLLIFPFLTALFLGRFLPVVHRRIEKMQILSFYLWAASLIIVTSRTVDSLVHQNGSEYHEELLIALFALIVCIGQFFIGRKIGKRYNEVIAAGQGLGQKNTILAIWMAQAYLDPIASIGPASYILWQNSINSYQLWKRRKSV